MSLQEALPPAIRQRFLAPAHAAPVPVAPRGGTASAIRPRADGRRLEGSAGDAERGTAVRFEMWIDAEGRIARAAFRAYGCPYTIAVCEWLATELESRALEQGVPGRPEQWAATLEVPLDRLGRLFVIEDALQQCFC